MRARDPGHEYALDCLDAAIPTDEILHFVKRVGDKYPGNHPPARHGTTTQEVLRALIDRTKYVDAQIDRTGLVSQDGHAHNRHAISGMRRALRALEVRAAEERKDPMAVAAILQAPEIELMPTCTTCGHVLCSRSVHP